MRWIAKLNRTVNHTRVAYATKTNVYADGIDL